MTIIKITIYITHAKLIQKEASEIFVGFWYLFLNAPRPTPLQPYYY